MGVDCPTRAARVAAGGPARLPKDLANGKGEGGKGGGKGGPWQPTKGQWETYYPGLSQTQWDSWCPPKDAGKGGAANWSGGGGQTLKRPLRRSSWTGFCNLGGAWQLHGEDAQSCCCRSPGGL